MDQLLTQLKVLRSKKELERNPYQRSRLVLSNPLTYILLFFASIVCGMIGFIEGVRELWQKL